MAHGHAHITSAADHVITALADIHVDIRLLLIVLGVGCLLILLTLQRLLLYVLQVSSLLLLFLSLIPNRIIDALRFDHRNAHILLTPHQRYRHIRPEKYSAIDSLGPIRNISINQRDRLLSYQIH